MRAVRLDYRFIFKNLQAGRQRIPKCPTGRKFQSVCAGSWNFPLQEGDSARQWRCTTHRYEDGSIAMNVLRAIEQTRLIAILRGNLKDRACEVATALSESGVLVMEVTLNSPDALQAIRTIRRYAGLSVSLGAGTVLSPEEVKQAFDAGAEFIVSPNMSPAVIEETKRLGMASFPGCFTCTEILNGLACGADAIKLFPAIAFSPASLRAILASLGSIRLIPTGGITAENAVDYLAAGAWAFGVGSEIVNLKSAGPLDTASLRERASAIVKAIREAPKENL